ncbi:sialic acid synthase [Anopheles nili]|uniref:sialic acid synthase n=1 Tax=Anopheles nili TaxID=185578 RepID=UPI00237AD16B|nr:sialic acid synthase [Anopheles nili]
MWNQKESKVFIVAEIGQNHQGSVEIAKQMIQAAKNSGADCVKFQRSNLSEKFTPSALTRPYVGPNSWGKTYGEHKEWLEFTLDQYRELQHFAFKLGILFTASAMDFSSFIELEQELVVPFVKVGSGDADNVPLLRYAANRPIPLVISTGMQDWDHVCNIYNTFRHRNDVGLLHCTSAYPTPPQDTLLRMIPLYRQHFPELTIGYSGHELGVQLSVASVALGAKIVERHFTLDKSWKGTDHQASLEPFEFARMVRYIRTLEKTVINNSKSITQHLASVLDQEDYNEEQLHAALRDVTTGDRRLLESEKPCHEKLGKSLVFADNFSCDVVISADNLRVKVSDTKGLTPKLYDSILGKTLKTAVLKDNPVLEQHF